MNSPTQLCSTTQISAPRDPGAPWWDSAVVYQVYPRSFADSDGDGYGDLPGATSRLSHLARLGVDAVWLSPFYTSPQADAGYDVANYRDIDPLFGTLADADALIERVHQLGMRVIVDLVPNHTSDEHEWFQAALAAGPGSPERDRYMFRDGKGPDGSEPPNDWVSVFGGPGWTRITEPDGTPGQWYLHIFDIKQPDLNWENPEVWEEFRSILRFWLDRGVDGFRVDVAHGLIKQEGLPDFARRAAMVSGVEDSDEPEYESAGPMWNQPGVHEVYRDWNRVLAEYDGDRMLVVEAWVEPLASLAEYVRSDEAHQAFNFDFLAAHWNATELRTVIENSIRANDHVGAPTTWVLSNHDVVRHVTRFGTAAAGGNIDAIGPEDDQPNRDLGARRGRAATLIQLALPGSAYLYQGEELGLPEHTTLPIDVRQDPTLARGGGLGRDGCRVPLPWDSTAPGLGFSPTGATWLPQGEDWDQYALDVQKNTPDSTYQMYREALRLRKNLGLGTGGLAWIDVTDPNVLAFANGGVMVFCNLGKTTVQLPFDLEVVLSSQPLTESTDGLALPPDTTVWTRRREGAKKSSPFGPD